MRCSLSPAETGTYSIGVYVNKYDTKYSTVFSTKVSVTLKNQFAPFLIPNQYVNYTSSSKAVGLAADITKSCKSDLDKVKIVYSYVVSNITYDYDRAANVQSGYLPDIDDVLAKKSGICFDYAALMTAMLRTQGIPTKLVVGYAGSVYHAWISTYTEETGWVNNIIYFDGNNWKLMDPTFASSGHEAYTADSSHYSAKFYY